jgi:hypothetical protein
VQRKSSIKYHLKEYDTILLVDKIGVQKSSRAAVGGWSPFDFVSFDFVGLFVVKFVAIA